MTRVTTFRLLSAIVVGVVLLAAGSANAAPATPIAKKAKKCKGEIAYLVSGKTCMATGRRCKPSRNADYKRWGWKCQKRAGKRTPSGRRKARHVLVPASLRTQRAGRAVIVGRNGRVSKSMALQAFSQTVSRLPGVKHRKGAVGRIRSASGPIRWLSRYRRQLTRAQRKVLARFYGASSARSATSRVDGQVVAKYQTMLEGVHTRIAAHMGYRINAQVSVWVPDQPEFDWAANRVTDWDFDKGDFVKPPGARGCQIELGPHFLAAPEGKQRFVLGHELFHCYQLNLASDAKEHFGRPSWLIEGGATWAGSTVAEQWSGPTPEESWLSWLTHPTISLDTRAYDAVGFFARLAESGGVNPWQLMRLLLTGGRGEEYERATDAAGELYWRWAAQGFAREPDWGSLWELRGAGLAGQPQRAPRVKVPAIKAHRSRALYGPRRANQLYKVEFDAAVITIEGNAFGAFRGSNGAQGPLAPGTYCTTTASCYCPPIGDRAVFAISGVKGEGKIRLRGRSLKSSECAQPEPRLTVSGPHEHTFTKPAVCSDYFGGGYQMVISEAVGDDTLFVRMIISEEDGFHGPGSYKFLGGDPFDPFVELGSVGGHWGTYEGADEELMGTTVLEPDLRSGALSARMPPSRGSGIATVSGTFRCGTG